VIPEHGERLAWLVEARDQLTLKAEDDAAAIRDWLTSQGLEEDDPRRRAAVEALITIPLEGAELCHSVRTMAEPLLQRGHAPTVADGRAGIRLVRTSQEIFCTLVDADLGANANPTLAARIERRLEKVKRCRRERPTCQER
jgi:formiminotetrahydrofolate cyclodeaminase